MDYDKMIEQLRSYTYWLGQSGPESHDIHPAICDEAATAIETLHTEIEEERAHRIHAEQHADAFLKDCEQLNAELERMTAERDAALGDLRKWSICATCKHYNPHGKKSHCKEKEEYLPGGNWAGCSKWKWRGIKEED